jgi:hypothetical protein
MNSFTAFRGAKNTSIINVIPSGDLNGIAVDESGYFDFTANSVTRVIVDCLGRTLDSNITEGDSVAYYGSNLEVEFGDLDLPAGTYRSVKIAIYIGSSTEPVVIAGPGLPFEIELAYHN